MPRIFTCFAALFSFLLMDAQVFHGTEANQRLKGAEMLRVSVITGKVQYALLSSGVQVNKEGLLPYWENIYQLKSPYGFQLLKSEKDELGFEHLRYQQTFNKI